MLVGRVCITANLSNLGKCTNKNLQFVLILQSSHSVIFLNIVVLKNLERLIVRICWSLSFNNVWDFRTATLLKRYSTIDASCEIQEMCHNSYSLQNLWKPASGSPQWITQVIRSTSKKRWSFKFVLHNSFSQPKTFSKTWVDTKHNSFTRWKFQALDIELKA